MPHICDSTVTKLWRYTKKSGMNISDDFLSSHNFMTLPPQNNILSQIYDFLQICVVRYLGAWINGFTDPQICFSSEWVGVVRRLTNAFEKNEKCHKFFIYGRKVWFSTTAVWSGLCLYKYYNVLGFCPFSPKNMILRIQRWKAPLILYSFDDISIDSFDLNLLMG